MNTSPWDSLLISDNSSLQSMDGVRSPDSQETDGMLSPESRPRAVTCINVSGEVSPRQSLRRSKSVRCRNQVGQTSFVYIITVINHFKCTKIISSNTDQVSITFLFSIGVFLKLLIHLNSDLSSVLEKSLLFFFFSSIREMLKMFIFKSLTGGSSKRIGVHKNVVHLS